MWLAVLGPLCARSDEVERVIRGRRLRALLAALLIRANEVLTVDGLAEVVWDGRPPSGAGVTTRSYVMRLRRMLGADLGRRIVTRGAGYLIELAEDELDLLAFERLCRAGGAAVRDGAWDQASAILVEALGLWRGDALVDVPSEVLRRDAVPRLVQARLQALEWRIEADLHLGADADLIGELRELATAHPLRERFSVQLMTALFGAGRQAEALTVYQRTRRLLVEELGVEPGSELQQAHHRLLNGQPPSGTSPSLTVAALSLCELPAALADFTGRDAEAGRLTGLLTVGSIGDGIVPVVVVSGAPGVGKTALAVHVAHHLRATFPDGQLFTALAGAAGQPREPSEVLGEMLRAFGVGPAAIPDTLEARSALYRSRVADKRILVVLDDAASARQVRPLLPGTAGSAALVTTRNRLTTLDGAVPVALDCLTREDAVSLLTRIVGGRRIHAEPEAAEQVVAGCGLLPLAVRIAGAKLAGRPSWPVGRLAAALRDERRRLDELVMDDLGVQASIRLSYNALDRPARRAFRRLALVGPHDFTDWVVAALLDQPDASEIVGVLCDKSLLIHAGVDATGQPRYRIHDLLRDYAAKRLADEPAEQRRAALDRLLHGYLELADLADLRLPREPSFPPAQRLSRRVVIPEQTALRLTADALSWFTTERLALITATEQACAAGWYQLAAKLADYQLASQDLQARSDDTARLWRTVLAAAEHDGDTGTAADARFRLALTTIWLGQVTDALPMLDQCATAFESADDDSSLAYCLSWRSHCLLSLQNFAEASRDAEQGLHYARQAADSNAESMNLRLLGIAFSHLGHTDTGLGHCRHAVDIAQQLPNPLAEYLALHALAAAHLAAGEPARTVDLARQALDQASKDTYPWGQARSLGLLGTAHHLLAQHDQAIDELSRALVILEHSHGRRIQAQCLYQLGQAHQALGHHKQATGYLHQSLSIFRGLNGCPVTGLDG